MTKIIAICIAIVLSGCATMTPGQKTAAWVVAGVAVTAIVISASKDDKAHGYCKPTFGGSGADIDFGCRWVNP